MFVVIIKYIVCVCMSVFVFCMYICLRLSMCVICLLIFVMDGCRFLGCEYNNVCLII